MPTPPTRRRIVVSTRPLGKLEGRITVARNIGPKPKTPHRRKRKAEDNSRAQRNSRKRLQSIDQVEGGIHSPSPLSSGPTLPQTPLQGLHSALEDVDIGNGNGEAEPIPSGLFQAMASTLSQGPNPTQPVGADSEDISLEFIEATFSEDCGFNQLTENLFVVNGWDRRRQLPTSRWYHLQRVPGRGTAVCTCPHWPSKQQCYHTQFLEVHGEDRFPDDDVISYYAEDAPILFTRYATQWEGEQNLNVFSVPALSMPTVNNRAIVQFEGMDSGLGSWSCSKDVQTSTCYHIRLACEFLEKNFGKGGDIFHGPKETQYDSSRIRSPRRHTPMSHLVRPPPIWACLNDEERLRERYESTLAFSTISNPIPLCETDVCPCSRTGSTYSPLLDSVQEICTIYGLSRAWNATVNLQKCQLCTKRMIGPDGRNLGVFNWNNRVFVTEDLLDDFTSAFLTSETTFVGFATTIKRRYQTHQSPIPFLPDKLFREIWFGFINLVDVNLRNEKMCPECGPTPNNTIWDGVTLAFHKRHLKATLEPPTITTDESPIRENVMYLKGQQCIVDKGLRSLLRKVIKGPSIIDGLILRQPTETRTDAVDEGSSDEEVGANNAMASTAQKEDRELRERFDAIPRVCRELRELDCGLGILFDHWFGLAALGARREAPKAYQRFFIQVTAEESVLQMMNKPALSDLAQFIASPSRSTIAPLITIPALYDVLRYEFEMTNGSVSGETFQACRWLHSRGQEVLGKLVDQNGSSIWGADQDAKADIEEKSWKLTGCHYSMEQIRRRPQYPNLKHDTGKESEGSQNTKRGNCSKYYSQYGENRLTGGIMCAWCPHSICYGFHCIPKGEGRNDVFSAIFTRWKEPPKRVIYDFACALAPYCLTREPEFFLDTEFRIDSFHAKDHTKCAPANFLATYADKDAELSTINTSAGECGNSGLLRIRKSVSYMAQDRAIAFTHIYLALWNRVRIIERLPLS